ncbi:MAG: A/G-specific adenine glycosylase [Pseudomonadota bacterium]|nr:A/G-specific adenine glycosylase [Pseudomonadota bacterium]
MSRDAFALRLLTWYDQHGRRDLPWKREPTPYRSWVAEIMLQQTRLETMIPYYARFMAAFPDIAALAGAPLDEVLHLWSGLGYYARARNLHRAAETIMAEHNGELPRTLKELMALPGIGRSTAGAILAQSLGQRHPILDGNVKRVLCRYHAIDGYPGRRDVEKKLWVLAERHTPEARIADYTQAIMDFGATLCRRTRPRCEECPQAESCLALAKGETDRYPAPRPKTRRPLRRATLLIIRNGAGKVLLERRPPTGIWGGLWSLPECASAGAARDSELAEWCLEQLGIAVDIEERMPELRHGFTHFELLINPVVVKASGYGGKIMEQDQRVWYNLQQKPPGGLAAPVAKLLATIGTKNREEPQ